MLNVNLYFILAHSTDLFPDIIVGVKTKIDSSNNIGEILSKQYQNNVIMVDRKGGGGG